MPVALKDFDDKSDAAFSPFVGLQQISSATAPLRPRIQTKVRGVYEHMEAFN
jgi:hypothetical protein